MQIDYLSPSSSYAIEEYASFLSERYRFISLSCIGFSLSGRPIPCIRLGNGKSARVFTGCHHGSEHITSLVLIKFISDFAAAFSSGNKFLGFDTSAIAEKASIYIVPMLNPDGADLCLGYFPSGHILYPRLISMNPAGRDFTHWQANARGVDLNHNYDAGFPECKKLERSASIYSGGPTRYGGIYPESEPETRALCALCRILCGSLSVAVALHSQGEEIYFDYNGIIPPKGKMLAGYFSEASGYRLATPDIAASHAGFKDWVIKEFGIPAFTIECGRGNNPLPPSDFVGIYKKVAPILLIAASFK